MNFATIFLLLSLSNNDQYLVDGHLYEIGAIAMAVARMEGYNRGTVCGMKVGGHTTLDGYTIFEDKAEGLRKCADKLGKQIDRYGFETALKVWKAVPPYESYIRDIKRILYQNN